ncbi:MAG: helix-turn-helix domain-containing protein, partial [Anaerolineae bacterium]
SIGSLRILERRLGRLAEKSAAMLQTVAKREQLLGEMRQLGFKIDARWAALARQGPSLEDADKLRASIDATEQAQIERLRSECDRALDTVGSWFEQARRCLLDGAEIVPQLLVHAEQVGKVWLRRDRSASQLRLAILRVRELLADAIEQLRSPMAAPPDPRAAGALLPEGKGDDALLTVAEAAQQLTISAKKLYRLAAQGRIPHVRLGRSLRFRRADLDRWLEQRVVRPRWT